MNGFVIGVAAIGVLTAFSLYCCVRVGAKEDRWMEERKWKGGNHADKGSS